MQSNLLKILKLWPLLLIGAVAWVCFVIWSNYVPAKITLSNSIEAKDVRISSKVTGRIDEIFIQEGNQVKKGQKLIILEGDEIKAQYEQAIANFKKAQSDFTDLKKGARVQEIEQAKAETNKIQTFLEESKTKHENALADFKRMESLYTEGAISKQTYDSYKTQKDVLEKEVKSYEHELTKAKEKENLVIEGPRIDQIKALSSYVEYTKAKVKEFEKYLNELTVVSPLDGEVSSFDLKIGEVIKATQPLLTITDLTDLYVRVYIPNTLLNKVKINQKVKLKADSYPKEIFEGYISYISAQAEYTPRNVQTPEERSKLVYGIKVQIKNKENKLRDGMYITVEL